MDEAAAVLFRLTTSCPRPARMHWMKTLVQLPPRKQ